MMRVPVTPEMIAAGRRAFLAQRKTLDDLYDFFDSDLDLFLRAIFRAMSAAHQSLPEEKAA